MNEQVVRQGVADGEEVVFEAGATIQGGVGAGARIRAKGDLIIEGLVDSATIETTGDLRLLKGAVAHHRGAHASECILRVVGSLHAEFLDTAVIDVGRGLIVESQVMNCRSVIHGWIDMPKGALVGGHTTVMRHVRVATLGSDSVVPTPILFEAVPRLDACLERLPVLCESLDKQWEAAKRELERLSMPGQILKPADKERQTELSFAVVEMEKLHHRCEAVGGLAREDLRRAATLDLTIEQTMFPGVALESPSGDHVVGKAVRGPIRIYRDRRGNLVGSSDPDDPEASAVPIKGLADLRPRPKAGAGPGRK